MYMSRRSDVLPAMDPGHNKSHCQWMARSLRTALLDTTAPLGMGIGTLYARTQGKVVVEISSVVPGGVAARLGVEAGDWLVKVGTRPLDMASRADVEGDGHISEAELGAMLAQARQLAPPAEGFVERHARSLLGIAPSALVEMRRELEIEARTVRAEGRSTSVDVLQREDVVDVAPEEVRRTDHAPLSLSHCS